MTKNLKKAVRLTHTLVQGLGEINVDERWPVNGSKALAINNKRQTRSILKAAKEVMVEHHDLLVKLND